MMSSREKEEYANEKFNTRSLLEAYNSITGDQDTEFAEEYEQNKNQDQDLSGALNYTYSQVMDSYREGTVDADIAGPKNAKNNKSD
jgi:hypothetical protein